MCLCGTENGMPIRHVCPVHGWNDREALLKGVSERLMEAYVAELISLVLGHYEASHWYNAKRAGLHKNLKILQTIA